MPDPKDRKAPKFKGKDVQEFLLSLEHLARACGIEHSKIPRYVLRYCSHNVRDVLAQEEVLTGSDWLAVKTRLIYIYGSQTRSYKASVKKLRKFAKKQEKKSMVHSRKSLDDYRNEFVKRLGSLVAQNQIAENDVRLLFFRGLPDKVRSDIKSALRETLKLSGRVMSQREPPTIEETLRAARDYYSGDDINRGDDDDDTTDSDTSGSETDSSSGLSDTDSSSDDDLSEGRKGKKKQKKKKKVAKIDGISKRLDKVDDLLNRIITQDRTAAIPMAIQPTPMLPQPSVQPQYSAMAGASSSGPDRRRCFVCGKMEGVNLDHGIGVRNCPETEALIREKILMFSPTEGRLVRCDGLQLPRMQTLPIGLAAYLRNEQQQRGGWPTTPRDPPPHTTSATCMSLGLFYDNRPVVQYDKLTTHSVSDAHKFSFPAVTRSKGKQTLGKATIEEVLDEPVTTVPTPMQQALQNPPKITITPPTPHISNTEEGWRKAQKERQRTRVEEVEDEETQGQTPSPRLKTGVKSTHIRFTSDLQDSVSMDALQDHLLDTKVTLTLREVLAMSPQLQKRLQNLVRTRREFDGKARVGESSYPSSLADCTAILPTDAPGAASVTFSPSEDLEELVIRYADAVVLGSSRLYAMASGLVDVVFGDQRATFLVDSGSELNLVSATLWEKTRLVIDKDGARWSLKGLGGEDVPLVGCCREAPLQLGGRNFDHHFFVSRSEKAHYDGILGQPWLEWYSANIQYSRGGPVTLQAYPTGDKNGAYASVKICAAENPRNSARLVL
ncbi:hypothetical protein PYCCODRAFT_1331315, partial [Trametes coccinea BRFM310]